MEVDTTKGPLRGRWLRINGNARQSREGIDDEADVRRYGGACLAERIRVENIGQGVLFDKGKKVAINPESSLPFFIHWMTWRNI
jgi:hypothetical protein